MKRTNKVRLTESQLHRVIKESVKKVLKEMDYDTMHDAYVSAYEQGRPEQGERIGKLYRDMYDPDEQWSPTMANYLGGSSYDNLDPKRYEVLDTVMPHNDLSSGNDEIRGHGNKYLGGRSCYLNKMGQKRLDWKQGKIPSSKMRQDIK